MKLGSRLLSWKVSRALSAAALLSAAVFGCASDSADNGIRDSNPDGTDADTNTDADGDDSGGDAGEAGETVDSWVDIIDVAAAGDEGAYTFEVTLHSSDIDCTEFADWWEVLTEDGALLYRRILAHPHTEGKSGNPVMRSGGPVEISPTDVVIVRGHMNNGGYSGAAMSGSVLGGFETAPDIEKEFAAEVESALPQPSACIPE